MHEKITSFEAACKDQGLDPNNKPDVSNIPEEFQGFVTANYEMAVIAKSLNRKEDGSFWEPDYTNYDERKWEPWFDLSEGSSGFSLDDSFCTRTYTTCGARLVYRTKEISNFAGTQHIDTYRRINFR